MSTTANDFGKTAPAKCRSCSRPMDTPLFCSDCHTLHPAEDRSHFELLGLEPTYDVDAADLGGHLAAGQEEHDDGNDYDRGAH